MMCDINTLFVVKNTLYIIHHISYVKKMIFQQLSEQLAALSHLISALDDYQYISKIAHLGNVSIGAHTRHIIEMLLCTTQGHENGSVDYINRNRNLLLESDRNFTLSFLQNINNQIVMPDKYLKMITEEDENLEENPITLPIFTTYFREIIYNTEHTIHHLALIKVALIEMQLIDLVDDSFGMAYATTKYKAQTYKV